MHGLLYFNFRKNIMDNPEQIFKTNLIGKETINNKAKKYLLNNISIIEYLERNNNLKNSILNSTINKYKLYQSEKEIDKDKKLDKNDFIPKTYENYIEHFLKQYKITNIIE